MASERCPDCDAPIKIATGIGPYCPNPSCKRLDDLASPSEPKGTNSEEREWRLIELERLQKRLNFATFSRSCAITRGNYDFWNRIVQQDERDIAEFRKQWFPQTKLDAFTDATPVKPNPDPKIIGSGRINDPFREFTA